LAALEQGTRPEEIDKAGAEVEQVRADLKNAQVTLERTASLVEDGILSKQALDDAQARYNAQVAKIASFEKSHRLLQLGPRREDIDAVRAQVEQLEGALALANTELSNTIIRAPVSGVILERNVEKGEFVTTGFVGDRGAKGYVVSIADLNDLQVELDISQSDFAKLEPNQACIVTTDAYPDKRYQGFIEEISPEANRQKGTIQIKVKIKDPDNFLRPEMNASVSFLAPDRTGAGSNYKPPVTVPAKVKTK
jgi:HlyD family secretion protein